MKTRKLKGWCFKNKDTGKLDPLESNLDWMASYGIFSTRKALLDNVWEMKPLGYEAVCIEMEIKEINLTTR